MKRLAILLMLPLSSALAQPAPASATADDPQFRARYEQQYQRVRALRPDMLVEELRLRVELVASRGSQVGAASNERRVRGFESALLQSLHETLCAGDEARTIAQSGPAAPVVDSVTSAAATQRLRTLGPDVAEISAITQRLIDSQGAEFCTLHSLDDVQ